MSLKQLTKEMIDEVFHPVLEITDLRRAQRQPLFSRKIGWYYAFQRDSGAWQLLSAVESSPQWGSTRQRTRFPRVHVWERCQVFENDEALWAWIAKNDVVIELPQPSSQAEVAVALYRLVYGDDWDAAVGVDGWPKVSPATAKYLFEKFIELDRRCHRGVLPGGLWLNVGFGQDESIPDWKVRPARLLFNSDTTLFHLYVDRGSYPRVRAVRQWQGADFYKEITIAPSIEEAQAECQKQVPYPIAWGPLTPVYPEAPDIPVYEMVSKWQSPYSEPTPSHSQKEALYA
jgi:hypothetical protein